LICGRCLVAIEAPQEVGADGVKQIIAIERARFPEIIDPLQAGVRSPPLVSRMNSWRFSSAVP
jgi:hypothetical protein